MKKEISGATLMKANSSGAGAMFMKKGAPAFDDGPAPLHEALNLCLHRGLYLSLLVFYTIRQKTWIGSITNPSLIKTEPFQKTYLKSSPEPLPRKLTVMTL